MTETERLAMLYLDALTTAKAPLWCCRAMLPAFHELIVALAVGADVPVEMVAEWLTGAAFQIAAGVPT